MCAALHAVFLPLQQLGCLQGRGSKSVLSCRRAFYVASRVTGLYLTASSGVANGTQAADGMSGR